LSGNLRGVNVRLRNGSQEAQEFVEKSSRGDRGARRGKNLDNIGQKA